MRYQVVSHSLSVDDDCLESRVVELLFQHRRLLAMIGRFGVTRERLGHLATSRELLELVDARFVTHEPTMTERLDAWHLTPAGTAAMGLTGS